MKPTILIFTVLTAACGLISAQEAHGNPKQAFEQLMEKARDAKNAGRTDEARELAEKAEMLRREMHELRLKNAHEGEKHAKHPPMKEAGPGPEKLEHLKQAVQHLHAAGMHDVAENVARMAENMHREMEEHARRERAAAAQKGAAPSAEIAELHQQIRHLQEQVEKLAAEVKKQSQPK
jgi:polyhydroxyalkanoate synthesis regulator phasin